MPLQASLAASFEAPESALHTTVVVLGVQVQLAPQMEEQQLAGMRSTVEAICLEFPDMQCAMLNLTSPK